MLCVALGACGGGQGGSGGDAETESRTTAASATPTCPTPSEVESSSAPETVAGADTNPPGTLDPLLTDDAATAGDLDAALTQLAQSPKPLGPRASTLRTAIARETPKPTFAAEALARARWQRLDVDAALQGIQDAAVRTCGTVFGADALEAFATVLPAPREGAGVQMSAGEDGNDTRPWATLGCESTGGNGYGYAPPQLYVDRCDQGVTIVDLKTGALTRIPDLLPEADEDDPRAPQLELVGDHLDWITVELTPAEGLDQAGWTSTLHVRDLTGAVVADTVLQKDRHTVDRDGRPDGVSELLAGDRHYLLLSGLSKDGFSVTDPTGEIRGTTEYPDGDWTTEPIGVLGVGEDPVSYVDPETGKEHPFAGHPRYSSTARVDDAGCGARMLVGASPGLFVRNPPDNVARLFTRDDSGLRATTVSTRTMFDDGDLRASDVAALTPSGVLLSQFEGGWIFYGFDGRRKWRLGDPVTDVENAVGHIVARNTSDERIIVDPETGRAADDLPDDVAETIVSLVPSTPAEDPVSTIVLIDTDSDTMMIERREDEDDAVSVVAVSYASICG